MQILGREEYLVGSHRRCLVRTTEDDQNYTCVTTLHRIHIEPVVCTYVLCTGAPLYVAPGFNSNTPSQNARLQSSRKVSWQVSFMQVQSFSILLMFYFMMLAGVIS